MNKFDRKLYDEQIVLTSKGVFGDNETAIHVDELAACSELMKAFLDDNNYQEMRLCSTNIGVVRTVRKNYRATP